MRKTVKRPCASCPNIIGARSNKTIYCRSCAQKVRHAQNPPANRRDRTPVDDFTESRAMFRDFRQGSRALLEAIRREHPEQVAV